MVTGKARDSSLIHPASAVTVSMYVPFSPEERSYDTASENSYSASHIAGTGRKNTVSPVEVSMRSIWPFSAVSGTRPSRESVNV